MNTSLLEILLGPCDMVSCHISVMCPFHLSTIDEHNFNENLSLLMWRCLMSHFCHVSFPSLNNRWTQVFLKSFSVNVMMFHVTSLSRVLSISQQQMNVTLMKIILWWCDVVWRYISAMFPFQHSAIDEHRYPINRSLLMWCCLMSQLCQISFSYLNKTWTQIS